MVNIDFDPVAHVYTKGGIKVPGVTTILKNAGLINFDFVSKEVLDAAALRGTEIHKMIELVNTGKARPEWFAEKRPDLFPFLEQQQKFESDLGIQYIESEFRVFHPKFYYAGTGDDIAVIDGHHWLLDTKSGVKAPWHGLQTAAYAKAKQLEMGLRKPFKRAAIYLSEDKYRFHPYTDPSDFDVFLAALSINNFKKGLRT